MKKLFAAYLGGYTPNCNIEVHDMVFVVGETFEDTLPLLVKKWFLKSYDKFHYDGYQDLTVVDGHRITISQDKQNSDLKLYYVHLGGYRPDELTEHHKNVFLVAHSAAEAKSRARGLWQEVAVPHKDVQCDIESCLQIDEIDGFYLKIEPTDERAKTELHLGYNLISQDVIRGVALPLD